MINVGDILSAVGMLSTMGHTMITVGLCWVLWGILSTVGDITSTMGDTIFCNLSTVGDIMIHAGGYHEYRGGVQSMGVLK